MNDNSKWILISPSKKCVSCGKEFVKIGGHRIIMQDARGLGFHDYVDNGRPKTEIIRYHGEEEFLTKEMIENSMRACSNNQRPWFCSCCGKQTCPACNHPLAIPNNFHYINEHGELFEAPIIEKNTSCTNPQCENHNSRKH